MIEHDYKKCLCYNCDNLDELGFDECDGVCESGPYYNIEGCKRCPARLKCAAFLHPELYEEDNNADN